MEEIWKPIKGYEGCYEISSLCRIRSIPRKIKSKSIGFAMTKERILKPWLCKSTKYYMVTLYKYHKSKKKSVHRLFAEAFIPNPENKPFIDHINGVRSDNRIENLRWVTHKENMNTPTAKENRIRSQSHSAKRVAQISILTGEVIQEYRSVGEVERQNGFRRGNISACCRGETEISFGYKWKYIL